jgi:hypothetical protein
MSCALLLGNSDDLIWRHFTSKTTNRCFAQYRWNLSSEIVTSLLFHNFRCIKELSVVTSWLYWGKWRSFLLHQCCEVWNKKVKFGWNIQGFIQAYTADILLKDFIHSIILSYFKWTKKTNKLVLIPRKFAWLK